MPISRRTLFAALAGLVAAPSAGQASIIDSTYLRKLFGWVRRSGSKPVWALGFDRGQPYWCGCEHKLVTICRCTELLVPKRWMPIMDDFTVPDTGIAGYCEPHTLRKLQRVMCVPEAREEWLKVDREEYLRERKGGTA